MSDEQPPKKRAPRKTPGKEAAPVEPMDAVPPPRPRRPRKKAETVEDAHPAAESVATAEAAPAKARAPRKRASKTASVDVAAVIPPDAVTSLARTKPAAAPRKPRARVTAPIASVPVQASLPIPAAIEPEPIVISATDQVVHVPPIEFVEQPALKPVAGTAAPTVTTHTAPVQVSEHHHDSKRVSQPLRRKAVRSHASPPTAPATSSQQMGARTPDVGASAMARLRHWRTLADPYLRLCRLDRPIGFLLLLWPTWWGLWAAAEGFPPWRALIVFTFGVVFMRSAGCVINDYADRWLDPQVKRTKMRPLATGEITAGQALLLFAGLLLASFGLVLLTNPLTIKLAFVGAFLAATYPFLKRYTHLPQVYLGVAFGWSIPMAFAAIQGEVPRLAWLLFLANILWTTAYDTLYAMVDRDDDLKVGAKSTAILFGDIDLIAVGMMQGAFVLTMIFVGQRLEVAWPYWTALALAAALFVWQHWRARRRDRDGCFRAFLDNNHVGMVVFAGLAIALAVR
jgi:4-hydroxybenzoate polyprenyltransferase